MYEHLMAEVRCINNSYGWKGTHAALRFIHAYEDEYIGTKVWQEYQRFIGVRINELKLFQKPLTSEPI